MLTPTRELCIQVTQALRSYGARKGVDVVAVFGGAPIRSQQAQLRAGGHVVVGTVGRVKDLISRHSLMLTSCRFVVLDEADEMLDLGFLEDVERIMALTPGSRQTALFSATMPPEIRKLSQKYLYDPVHVKVRAATLTVDTVEQFSLEVPQREKAEALVRVLEAEKPDQAIVFVRTKIRCDQLYRTLRDKGMNVKALHGDMSQGARDGVMLGFKGGRVPILVATDVAARGLDISSVTHVINFDVPTSPDVYVHRIGRTGRVGRSGRAITFYDPKQKRDIEAIERHTSTPMAPWTEGARVGTRKVEVKPKRHETKPHDAAPRRDGDGAPQRRRRPHPPRDRRRPRAGDRAEGPDPRDHDRGRNRRRGGPQHPRAGAVRLPRRAGRAGRGRSSPRSTARTSTGTSSAWSRFGLDPPPAPSPSGCAPEPMRRSAGILLHRRGDDGEREVLLVHPGGPFWAKKDAGAWSIPKGEHGDDEHAARRRPPRVRGGAGPAAAGRRAGSRSARSDRRAASS